MIVAVRRARVVQVTIDDVVGVISVRHGLVTAGRTMGVILGVP